MVDPRFFVKTASILLRMMAVRNEPLAEAGLDLPLRLGHLSGHGASKRRNNKLLRSIYALLASEESKDFAGLNFQASESLFNRQRQ